MLRFTLLCLQLLILLAVGQLSFECSMIFLLQELQGQEVPTLSSLFKAKHPKSLMSELWVKHILRGISEERSWWGWELTLGKARFLSLLAFCSLALSHCQQASGVAVHRIWCSCAGMALPQLPYLSCSNCSNGKMHQHRFWPSPCLLKKTPREELNTCIHPHCSMWVLLHH